MKQYVASPRSASNFFGEDGGVGVFDRLNMLFVIARVCVVLWFVVRVVCGVEVEGKECEVHRVTRFEEEEQGEGWGTKTNVKGEVGEKVRDAANCEMLDGILRQPLPATKHTWM